MNRRSFLKLSAGGIFLPQLIIPARSQTIIMGPVAAGGNVVSAPTSVTDNFNRVDANPMSTAMSDGVGTWVTGNGSRDPHKILSNKLVGTSSNNMSSVASPSFNGNQFASVTLGSVVTSCGPAVRIQSDTDSSCYCMYATSGTTLLVLQTTDAGAAGISGGSKTVTQLVEGDVLRVEVTGTSGQIDLEGFVNGVSIGTWYDDSDILLTGGQPGIFSGSDTCNWTGFTGGNL